MLSLIGCVGIVLGTFGGLYTWEEQQLAKSRFLQEMYQMFRKGKYVLVGQQRRCIDFFEEYRAQMEEITEVCGRVAQKLTKHSVAAGEMAWVGEWQESILKYRLNKEEQEILLASGTAFFGKNRKEVEELFGVYQNQFERLAKKSRQAHEEKRKVVLPVGALSGMMLIILLI